MSSIPRRNVQWQPPPARLEGDRLLKEAAAASNRFKTAGEMIEEQRANAPRAFVSSVPGISPEPPDYVPSDLGALREKLVEVAKDVEEIKHRPAIGGAVYHRARVSEGAIQNAVNGAISALILERAAIKTPYDYGAKPSDPHTADQSAAVQALVDAVRDSWDSTLGEFGQYRLKGYFADRTWRVETGINATFFRGKGAVFYGGTVHGACLDKPVFDLSASQQMFWDITVEGDTTNTPTCAFFLQRAEYPVGSGNIAGASHNDFSHVTGSGAFRCAFIVNAGAELITYPAREVTNSYRGLNSYIYFITGHTDYLEEHFGAGIMVSDYAVGYAAGGVSCLHHTFPGQANLRRRTYYNGTITGITKANPAVMTVSAATDALQNGYPVFLYSVTGMTEVNRITAYVSRLSSTTFGLYSDEALTTPINSTGYGTFTAGSVAGATGACVVICGGVKHFGPLSGYVVTYGSPWFIRDGSLGGGAIDAIETDVQHEVTPRTSVEYRTPNSGIGINDRNHKHSNLDSGQNTSYAFIDVTGPGYYRLRNLKLELGGMTTAPSAGIFSDPSKLHLPNFDIRVPLVAAWPGGAAFRDWPSGTLYTDDASPKVYGGPHETIAMDHTEVAAPADTNNNLLKTYAIGKLALPANAMLDVRVTGRCTGNVNNKFVRIFCAAQQLAYFNANGSQTTFDFAFRIHALTTTTQKALPLGNQGTGAFTGSGATGTVNTALGFNLGIYGQKNSAGDDLIIESVSVEIRR